MEDVSPKLLKQLQEVFNYSYKSSNKAMAFARKMSKGRITGADLNTYGKLLGECLEKAIKEVFTESNLPDGILYFNIAKSCLTPMLENNHYLASIAYTAYNDSVLKKKGLGIKTKEVKPNYDSIDGIIKYACEDGLDLNESVERICSTEKNFTLKSFDEIKSENAKMMSNLGFVTKVIRTAESNCCSWCQNLDGEYDYNDVRNHDNDVWKRHVGCLCMINTIYEQAPKK